MPMPRRRVPVRLAARAQAWRRRSIRERPPTRWVSVVCSCVCLCDGPCCSGPVDPNQSLPLYQQLQRAIKEAIEQHLLGADDALPSERQLAEDFAVSRITVRRAIEGLAQDGWIVSRQGSGNFVCTRVEKNFAKL